MGAHVRRTEAGFTIIEVMMFFAVTGALILGVLGSASVGVNTQRYNDAVNTFSAIVQQEFTNVTNVVNTKSIQSMCGAGPDSELPRGISGCAIFGRLMTIDNEGNIVRSNLVGRDPGISDDTDSELEVVSSYQPKIDVASQEKDTMNWGTKILKGTPEAGSYVTVLLLRSPRSGNVYSYVTHSTSSVVSTNEGLSELISDLASQASPQNGQSDSASQASPQNGQNQYMCVDRSGWVISPTRVITLAPFTSGPSGVSIVDESGSVCN